MLGKFHLIFLLKLGVVLDVLFGFFAKFLSCVFLVGTVVFGFVDEGHFLDFLVLDELFLVGEVQFLEV